MILASRLSPTPARHLARSGHAALAGVLLGLLLTPVEGTFHAADAGAIVVDAADAVPDAGDCGSKTNACNTIQAAVDAAPVGGKIKVKKGIYFESVTIDVADLSIKGKGKNAVVIDPEISDELPVCEGDPSRTVFAGFYSGPNCSRFDGTDQSTCEAAFAGDGDSGPVSCFWNAGDSTCFACDFPGAGCVNECLVCADQARTDFLGQGGSPCHARDGTDQATCETAWVINNNNDAIGCWWDAGSSTCEGCGPSNEGEGLCVNTCSAGDPEAGVTISAPGVTIKKVFVRNGVRNGILVERAAADTVLDSITVSGSRSDCIRIEADNVAVEKSAISSCGSEAIDASYYPPSGGTSLLNGLTLSGNAISLCDGGCVDVTGDNVTIVSNAISVSEDGDCVYLSGDDATVRNNELSNCDGSGVELRGDRFTVADNDTFATSDDGYDLTCDACAGSSVTGNVASDLPDTDHGFELEAGDAGLVAEENEALRTSGAGFSVYGEGIVLRGNVAEATGGPYDSAGFLIVGTGHTLESNVSRGSHGDGFSVDGTGHVLTGNQATGNLEDGFDVQEFADTVALTGNTATGNLGMGIEVSLGATMTTVEDNVASGNGVDSCDEGTGTTASGNTFGTTSVLCQFGD